MLICGNCGCNSSYVIDSRNTAEGNNYLRRRRVCEKCRHTFRTVEISRDEYEDMLLRLESADRIIKLVDIMK